VSVTETVTLPAQPVSGVVRYVPLGGDGIEQPLAAYAIRTWALTGDATAGNVAFILNMDDRYCSLISYYSMRLTQATPADADIRRSVTAATTGAAVDTNVITSISGTVSSGACAQTFVPPPVVMPGGSDRAVLTLRLLNVDTDVFQFDALIYLFSIRARELTPMWPLLAARGSN